MAAEYRTLSISNVNDAQDISSVLQGLGFAVQTKIDVNHRQMDEAVKEFVQKIQNGDVALFYFSGHGSQVKGENYLLPVGGSIESESDVYYDAVSVGRILAKLVESRNKINIVILDACRNNPFKGFRSTSKGLSPMDAPVGTFIAYATAPGSVAADGTDRNSPYAKHLMQALKSKGIKIEDVFKQVLREVRKETEGNQVPWIASSLQDEFWFNPGDTSLPVTEPARVTLSPGSEPPNYKEQIEREKRESEQEIAKLREARRVAALERERLEREKQETQREIDRQKQQQRERVASLPAPTPARPATSEESEVAKLQRPAQQGDPRCQILLGFRYKMGKGVPKDYVEAVKWFRKAADQGSALGQNDLGVMYRDGLGVARDYGEALKRFKKAVEKGSSQGQVSLGYMYENGFGVPKDYQEAIKWYRKAADQGNATAQKNLGVMYRDALGVPKDYVEARKWLRKAADRGSATAQNNLGLMYRDGAGVAQDQAEARKWLTKAADQGNEDAKKELQNLGATTSR